MLTLRDRALLVKLYYQTNDNASAALREYRRLKGLRKGPMTIAGLRKMVLRFENSGTLQVLPGRGHKPIRNEELHAVATAIEDPTAGPSSARAISRQLDMPYSTVWKILRKLLKFYPYKISRTQQLLQGDAETRLHFSLTFLARMEVEESWPWNILWSDEAHFHLNGTVNTHNCRIWASENSHAFQEIPLHSPKVTVWCGFTSSFIIGPYFFEENTPTGPKTCSVNAEKYRTMLLNFAIPQLQQRGCLESTIFMQDGAPPHIGLRVQEVLRQHFTNDQIISRAFPVKWPARSPDLTPCDFWLWGHLKRLVYQGNVDNVATLKDRITLHVKQINEHLLHSAVENVVQRMHFLEHMQGQHIEPHM